MNRLFMYALATSFLSLAACSTEAAETDAPAVDDGLEPAAIVYSPNADGTWSADAKTPTAYYTIPPTMTGSAVFTGPSGKTRKMGVCLLQMTSTTCTVPSGTNPLTGQPYTKAEKQASIDSQCASSPTTLPSGGARYCTTSGSTTKHCAFRAGTQTDFCAGSPALGGTAVAPGTYTTYAVDVPARVSHVSYACFESCSVADPSSSSIGRIAIDYCAKYPNDPLCWP